MWVENRNGKFKYTERYKDPITNKYKYVSVTLNSDSRQAWNQATKILSQRIADKLDSKQPNTDTSFESVSEDWLNVKKKSVKPSTLTAYEARLRKANEIIGDIPIGELTSGQINKMFLDWFEAGLSFKTVSERKKLIAKIFEFADRYDYISSDEVGRNLIAERVNLPKPNDDKYLEPEEADQLFARFEEDGREEYADLLRLQMYTGMRYSEVNALHLEQIDLKEMTINIDRQYDRSNYIFTSPKGNTSRVININVDALNLIQKVLRRRKILLLAYGVPETDLLFFNELGKPIDISYVNILLHKYETKDKPLTTHIFRHTFITRMAENNVSSKLIAEHVGHKSTDLIDRVYAHFSEKMQKDLKKAIQRVRF